MAANSATHAMLAADLPAFTAADCAFLAEFQSKPNWKTVGPEERARYQSLRARLKSLSQYVAAAAEAGVALTAAESTQNVSGHAAADMWCCVYPAPAGH